jgi:dihydrofolate synthase/folylpolyglutamate synthase
MSVKAMPLKDMPKTLDEWLVHLQQAHPVEIDLGLKRITEVGLKLGLTDLKSKVITVAGTNGKGTTCAFLEAVLVAAGYSVGVYSSPHIRRFTERLRINKQELEEQVHCDAFAYIERNRGDVSLTYFEMVTLSCLSILQKSRCDVVLLEVGLGGRLDATNMVASDISVITTIGIDHVDWLGDDRDVIAYEKAGVFRKNKPVVCGELDPPQTLIDYASELNCAIKYGNRDFKFIEEASGWSWHSAKGAVISHLKPTMMPIQNASTALAVIETLSELEVEPIVIDVEVVRQAIENASLEGRLQQVTYQGKSNIYLDVAHNPQSAMYLASQLMKFKATGATIFAIAGMLEDKDCTGTFDALNGVIDDYSLIPLTCYRGATAQSLLKSFNESASSNQIRVNLFENIDLAYKNIQKTLLSSDIIIVFGSFYTVSDFLTYSQG